MSEILEREIVTHTGYGVINICKSDKAANQVPKEHCKQVPKKVEKQVPRTHCKRVPREIGIERVVY